MFTMLPLICIFVYVLLSFFSIWPAVSFFLYYKTEIEYLFFFFTALLL